MNVWFDQIDSQFEQHRDIHAIFFWHSRRITTTKRRLFVAFLFYKPRETSRVRNLRGKHFENWSAKKWMQMELKNKSYNNDNLL